MVYDNGIAEDSHTVHLMFAASLERTKTVGSLSLQRVNLDDFISEKMIKLRGKNNNNNGRTVELLFSFEDIFFLIFDSGGSIERQKNDLSH